MRNFNLSQASHAQITSVRRMNTAQPQQLQQRADALNFALTKAKLLRPSRGAFARQTAQDAVGSSVDVSGSNRPVKNLMRKPRPISSMRLPSRPHF